MMRFRLGATSYTFPADLLMNADRLGGLADDVELVLFEVEGHSNLPDCAQVQALRRLAEQHGLTYTVHLPLDLRFAAEHPSLALAGRIIDLTAALHPYAYVAHLDAREPMASGAWADWQETCVAGLLRLLERIGGDADRLCIENLERWPYEAMLPILERVPVAFCLDIGHLWLAGLDVATAVAQVGGRTRVVHLHGINGRDHTSLVHVPQAQVDEALDALAGAGFRGVVTLEVFSEDEFRGSRDLVLDWAARRGMPLGRDEGV